ncbi:MAG: M28 family peptidase [Flavobacteriaceae bacterium]|nr:M28 family peptidase [Flavobacteriaceae bacterium]
MKYLQYIIIFLFFIASCTSPQQPIKELEAKNNPTNFAKSILEKDLQLQLQIFASDDFSGRETGTNGEQKAVKFLVDYYKNIGLESVQANGLYRQEVPLFKGELPKTIMTIADTAIPNGNGYVCLQHFDSQNIELVDVGFGVETEEYSDYTDKNVHNKWVRIKIGTPKAITNSKTKWSSWKKSYDKRLEIAKKNGAMGIVIADDAAFNQAQRRMEYMQKSKHRGIKLLSESEMDFGVLYARGTFANKMLDQGTIAVQNPDPSHKSYNVAAMIKGSEKPKEYIILSAHLDHIGIDQKGNINNGADDDGSGNVALMEIAAAFQEAKKAGKGPKRSIVFLHVTGEEKGLLGSKYYTDNDPLVPLKNTVANLNIDMIGRIDPKRDGDRNYIYLIGSDRLSSELHTISESVNQKYCKITLDYRFNAKNDPNRFYYRSDHYNFAKNNIPVIFYFNGTHADYHRHTDTVDKINFDLLENRSRLVFYTAWELANRENRIVVDKN